MQFRKHIVARFLLPLAAVAAFMLPAAPARASAFSDIAQGIGLFLGFVRDGVITPIRDSFCGQYLAGQANGQTPDAFDALVYGRVCGGYTPPAPNAAPAVTGFSTSTFSSLFNLNFNTPAFPFSLGPGLSFDTGSSSAASAALSAASSAPVSLPAASTSAILPGALVATSAPSGVSLDPASILYWTNISRADNGSLKPLTENATLDAIARIRVNDMFAKQYFSHYSPTGDNVSLEANANGYQYITIGENIALGNFGSSRDLVTAWMASPGHRANILNTGYTEIGIYAAEGTYQGTSVWIASEVFGEPLSACPSPDPSLKQQVTSGEAQASGMLAQLNSMQANLAAMDSANTSAYNAAAAQYNTLATEYNALVANVKTLAAQYNAAVNAFNACIKA